jgi:non-ribosomal peptide synthetase component F
MSDLSKQLETLSPKKRALFELLFKEQAKRAAPEQTIPRRTADGPAPLSYGQQQMWFLDQIEPDSYHYNTPAAIRLRGRLDARALADALGEIVRRHDVLRTTFILAGDEPAQVVAPAVPFSLPEVDLVGVPAEAREAEALRLATEEERRPFDLTRGPLFRATLLRLGEEDHMLLVTMHHIVTDGWSMEIFFRELTTLYGAFAAGRPSPLAELPVQYADYAEWQRGWLTGAVLDSQLSYWKERLTGSPAVLELPADRPRPPVQTYNGAAVSFALPRELGEGLKTLSQQQGATLFMTLLTAFKVLLHRYTGQEDILVGTPMGNRTWPEIENLIGFFLNTVVLRTKLSGRQSFRELLSQVRSVTLGAMTNQHLPLEKVMEELQIRRDMSHNPLFQVFFNLLFSKPKMDFAGLDATVTNTEYGTAKFDLSLEMVDTGEEVVGWLVYNTDLYERETAQRMAGHFHALLEAALKDPDRAVADLPILTAAERRQFERWNDTRAAYPADALVHELFEAQAERTPEAVAVVCGGDRLTYRQLNERANRLAGSLVRRGVGPDVLVALYGERDADLLTAILAVFKAGGAYLPLDPFYPARRLRQVIEQSGCAFVLAAGAAGARAEEALGAGQADARPRPPVLLIDELVRGESAAENLTARARPNNLAYVIYTSGSTGVPKGAMVEHRGMLNHLFAKINDLGLTADDVVAETASQAFDISVWQFLAALLVGGRVHIVGDEIAHEPARRGRPKRRDSGGCWRPARRCRRNSAAAGSASSPRSRCSTLTARPSVPTT